MTESASRKSLNDKIALLIDQGRYRQALPLAEQLCSDESASGEPAERADSLEYFGVLLRELGHYGRAEAPLLQALSARAALGKEHPHYARTMNELGRLYEELARYPAAERLYRGSLSICEKALGSDHPDTARHQFELAAVLDLMARFPEAAELHTLARETRRKVLGEAHQDYGMSLLPRAWALWRRGQILEAQKIARQAIETLEKALGPMHPDLAVGLQLMARISVHQARLPEAEALALRVLEIRKEVVGEQHHRYAAALENLSVVRAVQGKAAEAERLARQGVAITRTALGEQHPYVADGLSALSYALQVRQQFPDAEQTIRQAMTIYRTVHGEHHSHIAGCLRDLAEVEMARHHFAEAEEHFRTHQDILARYGDAVIFEAVEGLQGLARSLAAQNRFNDAVTAGEQAIARARTAVIQTKESSGTGGEIMLAGALDALARVYQARGRLTEAEPLWREMLECRGRALGVRHPLYGEGLRNLAQLAVARGDMKEATRLEEEALEIVLEAVGENHAQTVQALGTLAEVYMQSGEQAGLERAEELLLRAAEIERQLYQTGDLNETQPKTHDPSTIEDSGEAGVDRFGTVRRLARLYMTMNNFAAAEVRYREMLEQVRLVRGEEHLDYASALQDLATLYHQVGDLNSAERLYEQACDVRRARAGEDSPEFASSLMGLAMIHQAVGRLEEAGPLYRRAVEIHQASVGDDNPATLRCLHSEALFLQANGESQRALEQLTDVRDRLIAVAGENSPMLIPVLGDLARTYGSMGDHLRAEPNLQRILEINRLAYPRDTLQHARDAVNLGMTYRALGELDRVEPLFRQAFEIVERLHGPEHPETAGTLGMLANVTLALERHEEAEKLYRRALEVTRAAVGAAHPASLNMLTELAGIEAMRGRFAEAEPLYIQARDLFRRTHGENHMEYVNLLRLVANLYLAWNKPDLAEQALSQRVSIVRRLLGPTNPGLVPAMQMLADCQRQRGKLDEAEASSRTAVEMLRKGIKQGSGERSGSGSENVATGVNELGLALAENNLATLYLVRNEPAKAEPLLRGAVAEIERRVGQEHPARLGAMTNLASLCGILGRTEEAVSLLEHIAGVEDITLPAMFTIQGERNRALSCHPAQENFETLLSLTQKPPEGTPRSAILDTSYRPKHHTIPLASLVLRRKRFGMEVLCAPPYPLWSERYPEHATALRRMWLLDRQIANKRMGGPGEEGLEEHNQILESWTEERDHLEERLASRVPELALRRMFLKVTAPQVAETLGPTRVLVEFIYHREADFQRTNRDTVGPPGRLILERPRHYTAMLLRGGDTPGLQFVYLGAAELLDGLIKRWRRALEEGDDETAGPNLWSAMWERLTPYTKGTEEIVIAPDGELSQVPLALLPVAKPDPRRPEQRVTQIVTGRDLLRPKVQKSAPTGSLVVDQTMTRVTLLERLRQGRPRVLRLEVPGYFLGDSTVGPPSVWESPLVRSGLLMAGEERLTALDVTAMDLWGTTVVMPSALSGRSREPDEEFPPWPRITGLIHAFFQAGASHVLMPLWQSTGDVTTRVIAAIEAGKPAQDALRDVIGAGRSPWICVGP